MYKICHVANDGMFLGPGISKKQKETRINRNLIVNVPIHIEQQSIKKLLRKWRRSDAFVLSKFAC